jgi:hypothetical protein
VIIILVIRLATGSARVQTVADAETPPSPPVPPVSAEIQLPVQWLVYTFFSASKQPNTDAQHYIIL